MLISLPQIKFLHYSRMCGLHFEEILSHQMIRLGLESRRQETFNLLPLLCSVITSFTSMDLWLHCLF